MESEVEDHSNDNKLVDFLENPPSPVLSNHKMSRKLLRCRRLQKKSRVKLTNRFPNESVDKEKWERKTPQFLTEETLTPSQTDAILETIDILEGDTNENKGVIENFDFKKPVSPCVKKFQECGGFRTATGKNIELSSAAISKCKELFEDILHPVDNSCAKSRSNKHSFLSKISGSDRLVNTKNMLEMNTSLISTSATNFGESSKVSSEEIQRMFGDLLTFVNVEENKIEHKVCQQETSPDQNFKGFDATVIEGAQKRVESFVDCFKKFTANAKMESSRKQQSFNDLPQFNRFKFDSICVSSNSVPDSFCALNNVDFQTASGNCISLANEALKKAQKTFQLAELDCILMNNEQKNCSNVGFKTASGNSVSLSKNALKKAQQLYEKIEASINDSQMQQNVLPEVQLDNSKESGVFELLQNDNDSLHTVGIKTDSANSVGLSKNALEKAQQFYQKIGASTDDPQIPKNVQLDNSKESNISALHKSGRKRRLGVSHGKPLQFSADKLEHAKLIFEKDRSFKMSPVHINSSLVYSSTPEKNSSTVQFSSDITPIKSVNPKPQIEFPDFSPIVIKEFARGTVKEYFENETKMLEMKLKIFVERNEGLKTQKKQLENRCEDQKRNGALFNLKKNSERIALQNFVKPGPSRVGYISPQNAEFVHFNYSEQNLAIFTSTDGARVIPDINDFVGVTEIEIAVKTMPGVVPRLVPHGWIRNHFKWIVWKLASYELFTLNLKGCLTLDNVLLQLKYRYDREIDRAERSTLRKILEKDDAPQKRMVLCVADIFNLHNDKFELELTDGWYSVRTVIDEALCGQVVKKRIQVGTKLMICGAELLNCDGCHPLEVNDHVRLKINCNSTRRAVWYCKLGYQRCPKPLPLKLQSLYPKGGLIGCVKVYVARIYPLKFLEKQNSLSVWRNSKAEELRAQVWENERLKRIEEVQAVIRKDYEKNFGNKQNVNVKLSRDEIRNITCPEMLYSFCQNSNDPETLQELLTSEQKSSFMEYQQRVVAQQQQEMNDGIGKLQMNKRDVSSVLQLLVVDVMDRQEKCSLFQIWNPSDSGFIKESSVFSVYNVLPKYNGVLYSGRQTQFHPVSEDFPKLHKYKRTVSPISLLSDFGNTLFFNEFDTIGIVVQIKLNSFDQDIWLTDLCGRLLFVRVFEGPKNCLLFDNLKSGQLVAMSNLVFRQSHQQFGEAIASHSTVVSCYPQLKHLQEGVDTFNKQLPQDLDGFLQKCNERIACHVDKMNMSKHVSSLVSNTSGVSDDELEESTLVHSRITRTDVALSLIDIDKLI